MLDHGEILRVSQVLVSPVHLHVNVPVPHPYREGECAGAGDLVEGSEAPPCSYV